MANANTLALMVGGDLATKVSAQLADRNMPSALLRRSAPQLAENTAYQRIQADLLAPESLTAIPSGVSHLLYAVTPDARTEQGYLAAYVHGLRNLLNTLDITKLQRAVFVSSTAVYGASADWVSEDTREAPEGFNGRILLQAEELFRTTLKGKAVILRLSGIYGPERNQLLQRLQRQAAPEIQTDQWTNRIHIDDATNACVHLLTLPQAAGIYIGTDNTPIPMSILYNELRRMLGVATMSSPPPSSVPRVGKRLSNRRLKESGFQMKWPDSLQGYRAIIEQCKTSRDTDQPAARS